MFSFTAKPKPKPKIVSVHSFRGGTGKSNITSNLAATIACQGVRVGIIDTDIQSPGIHVLFGMNENRIKYTLNDYLWGRCKIEETAYDVSSVLQRQDVQVHRDSRIYLIPSSIKVGEISRVIREGYSVNRLNEGFRKLITNLKLDYLFIDTHPGLNEETLLSISISTILVIILRPDRQDFQGTAVTVDVARKLAVPKMLLVLNKVLPEFDLTTLHHQVETSLKTQLVGILPLSEDLIRLASSDVFCLCHTHHGWTQEIQGIARQITYD
ncbi:MinD/ParA family protein [Leptolyngbya sp. 7M]|uniref:MinD/ParA family ATP-binding protein n=1 Tax=Leptolyngbya sp. 7M TaxID=2812896 RepID=UPI001B8CAB84|nr:MinD/ParA family protein [Leptolyngbya sp. 7M]QYO66880.1 MinD/ParA family protein [Leptolyngbya sp. 7M]